MTAIRGSEDSVHKLKWFDDVTNWKAIYMYKKLRRLTVYVRA